MDDEAQKVINEVPEKPAAMTILTRDVILSKVELARELVPVPEWGGSVWVRELTAAERDAYEASLMEATARRGRNAPLTIKTKLANAKAQMAVKCVVNEAGQRLFSDADAIALGKLSSAALNRVIDVAQRLSGMTEEDLEELEGN